MKAKQILFNGESVRGILDGRKVQTRRVVKPQPPPCQIGPDAMFARGDGWRYSGVVYEGDSVETCPYGQPGGLLWVRETAKGQCYGGRRGQLPDWIELTYRADEERGRFERSDFGPYHFTKWTPSIFMPCWASRITLRVKRVWVERVQDISLYDAVQEGYPDYTFPVPDEKRRCALISREFNVLLPKVRKWFVELWDEINKKRGFGWDVNPWVWCVEFEVAG